MEDAALVIAITEAQRAAERYQVLEDMLRAAMKEMHSFWLSVDDDLRLRGAVGGTMLVLQDRGRDEEVQRLTGEMNALRALSAACSIPGVSLDCGVFENLNPVGILKMWADTKE